jgi:NAD(P)-dependent dehydrogenase (short-subunit alcohol dehydrogenase family)
MRKELGGVMTVRKRVIVTGASSDVGVALVEELLHAECEVYGQYYANKAKLDKFNGIENFRAVPKDFCSVTQVEDFIKEIIKKDHRIDIIVNTIGPLFHKDIKDMTPEEWRSQMHFNCDLAFYLFHFAKPHLIESKGHMVNFAFAGAQILSSRTHTTPYCSAKAGIVVLTKSLAAALAPFSVRVNAISPGLVDILPIQSEARKEMAKDIPWGRPARPEEVAMVLKWLLFSSPDYLTGALIPVAGAWEYI